MSTLIGCRKDAHAALKKAAAQLAAAHRGEVKFASTMSKKFSFWLELATRSDRARFFSIGDESETRIFRGDRPASVLAGVAWYRHHTEAGRCPVLPLVKISPYPHRLIMEDFPFGCYTPTGFEFDLDAYATNLAALGFTGMECNRFSAQQLLEPFHWNYEFTNPSPAYFVHTCHHAGVWTKELIDANRAELKRTIAAAQRNGLEPIFTAFLPRPYPECFFRVHPDWRGQEVHNSYLSAGNHPPEYVLNTDLPQVQEFYRDVFAALLDDFPELRHLFFWHSDLGTGFWGDGQGPAKLTLADRVAGFHQMLQQLIAERARPVDVWLNPWGLARQQLDRLAETLPAGVNFSIKDNPGLRTFWGSAPSECADATIIRGELGEIPLKVIAAAQHTGRRVCLGQYQDFSEDLDPVIGVPHPIMTFRKFKTLERLKPECSALHWGTISPDICPVNLNRDVIREMTWDDSVGVFAELIDRLIPAGLNDSDRDDLLQAWLEIDAALCRWPQHWGLRLQDIGLRLRWLLRPFNVAGRRYTESELAYILDYQIYRIDYQNPFKSFLDVTPAQAWEIGLFYRQMDVAMYRAEDLFHRLAARVGDSIGTWLNAQLNATITLRCFWQTIGNVFYFYGLRDGRPEAAADWKQAELERTVRREIANTTTTIAHLRHHPETIVIAGHGKWGQCLGPDYLDDFNAKLELMRRDCHKVNS